MPTPLGLIQVRGRRSFFVLRIARRPCSRILLTAIVHRAGVHGTPVRAPVLESNLWARRPCRRAARPTPATHTLRRAACCPAAWDDEGRWWYRVALDIPAAAVRPVDGHDYTQVPMQSLHSAGCCRPCRTTERGAGALILYTEGCWVAGGRLTPVDDLQEAATPFAHGLRPDAQFGGDLLLRVSASWVLIVHHVVFDLQDRPLEFAEATYPPHRWAFEQWYPLT